MAEMQEFSPGGASSVTLSTSQRKHLALVGLAAAALFASFWGGVVYQENRATTRNSPSVRTVNQAGQYYTTGLLQNNSLLDVQSY